MKKIFFITLLLSLVGCVQPASEELSFVLPSQLEGCKFYRLNSYQAQIIVTDCRRKKPLPSDEDGQISATSVKTNE